MTWHVIVHSDNGMFTFTELFSSSVNVLPHLPLVDHLRWANSAFDMQTCATQNSAYCVTAVPLRSKRAVTDFYCAMNEVLSVCLSVCRCRAGRHYASGEGGAQGRAHSVTRI
jgi:hypothetical protein